jgi:hypothetical protein
VLSCRYGAELDAVSPKVTTLINCFFLKSPRSISTLLVLCHAVLLCRYGAELDAVSPKGWTPLSYAKAHGKYGPTEEAGIYPEVRGSCNSSSTPA